MTHELEEEKQKHRKESVNHNAHNMENDDEEQEENNELDSSSLEVRTRKIIEIVQTLSDNCYV